MRKGWNGPSRYIGSLLVLSALILSFVLPPPTSSRPLADEPSSRSVAQFGSSLPISQASQIERRQMFGSIPVYFEANRGQHDQRVRYTARGKGYTLFLTATDAVYVLGNPECGTRNDDSSMPLVKGRKLESEIQTPQCAQALALWMKLTGANPNSGFRGFDELPTKTNYFIGSDESKWYSDVSTYSSVEIRDVYQGIDALWYGKPHGEIQYDFVVKPQANPSQIEWQIEGAEEVAINAAGELEIRTQYGVLKQKAPYSYQEIDNGKQEVRSRFVIKEQQGAGISNQQSYRVGFAVDSYDSTKPLVIDPSVNLSKLAFSTLLGGHAVDVGRAIAVDRSGNVYVVGETDSTSFPTTAGIFDISQNGGSDVFVSKLNASGTSLIYSTFLGGSGSENGLGIALDGSGNAFITGVTEDSAIDYPTTAGAFDTTHNGVIDVFVTRLNASGSALDYSTFIGGSSFDVASGIAVDASGNAFVTGNTQDSAIDYPTTIGAFDTTHNGGHDVFVTKLNVRGTALTYSTLIGGNGNDISFSIAIDASGNAFVTGLTGDSSIDYPTTVGAFDTTPNGLDDVFVTKLNAAGSSLIYSTFIGGSGFDLGDAIAIDVSGNAFITGSTQDGAIHYPTTVGAFDTTPNGVNFDAFVTKLNATGSALIYSTFIGGSSHDYGNSIAVDTSGNAFVTGQTLDIESTIDYPTTAGAFDTTHNGDYDVFVTKLNATGSALVYSTLIGGSGFDGGYDIAIDISGNAFVTGQTVDSTTDYPTTSAAFQPVHNGGHDAFVTKLGDFSISGRAVDLSGHPLPNTAVSLSGSLTGFMLTDATGYFGFSDTLFGGQFLITASQANTIFNPETYQITNFNRNHEVIFVGQHASPVGGTEALKARMASTKFLREK